MTRKPNINLFIVGAAKSGTTSLYNYLSQHEAVFFPKVKEPNFYSKISSEDKLVLKDPKPGVFYHNKVINNKDIYFALYKDSSDFKIVGDASPSYLWDNGAARRIFNDFNSARILIILRNPVYRTYSHFLMNLKSGLEKNNDFLSALKRDKLITPKVWGDGKVMLYEELGMYFNQVKVYYDIFKESQIKVVIYEEFFSDIENGLKELFTFLELEYSTNIDIEKVHNKYTTPKNTFSSFMLKHKAKLNFLRRIIPNKVKIFFNENFLFKPASKPPITEGAKEYLKNVYREDITKLEGLLGRSLNVWR